MENLKKETQKQRDRERKRKSRVIQNEVNARIAGVQAQAEYNCKFCGTAILKSSRNAFLTILVL